MKLSVKIQSASPLLMHSGQTVDQTNHYAKLLKKISSKRGKTEADLKEMSRIEFIAGLYLNDDNKVILPIDILDATIVNGAKKDKLGMQAKSGIFVTDDSILEFKDSDKTADELLEMGIYTFKKAVRVGQAKVIRTRPIFKTWGATINLEYDKDIIDADSVVRAVRRAGEVVGVGDWRPRFGRFTVVE